MKILELPFKNKVGFANYYEAQSNSDVFNFIEKFKIFRILGEGFNTLVVNEEINTPILRITKKGIREISNKGISLVKISAGESWNNVVDYAINNNLGGIENLTDIPGSAGAAPIQNIGAYGVELSDVFKYCTAYDVRKKKIIKIPKSECHFGYRNSIFKQDPNRFLILSIVLELKHSSHHNLNLSYPDIKNTIEEMRLFNPTIEECRNIISRIRKNKLPPIKDEIGSAGSFFKNPIVSQVDLDRILDINKNIRWFNLQSSNKYKISAASLIENSGLKGYELNGVGTYKNQPLVIVNLNKCNGEKIWEFSKFIIQKVKNNFGIELIPEVNIWNIE